MQGEAIAERHSKIYRLWLFIPASGMAAVWLALYERAPAAVPSPQFYILCRTPGSLTASTLASILFIVTAAAVSVTGTVRAIRTPSRRPLRPMLHLAVALMLLVGADSMAYLGSGIAYRTTLHNGPDIATCEGSYHVTPGWFFFLAPEDRGQWSSNAVEPG
ncbi:hypothetical protein AB0C96_38605 [Streptomyces sp. NPDC048506]|uniref:hypothetical protein n=1 Tax=Streptomyces sp. NPDC048506 TaxID=3155028 RepID=UPI00343A30E5